MPLPYHFLLGSGQSRAESAFAHTVVGRGRGRQEAQGQAKAKAAAAAAVFASYLKPVRRRIALLLDYQGRTQLALCIPLTRATTADESPQYEPGSPERSCQATYTRAIKAQLPWLRLSGPSILPDRNLESWTDYPYEYFATFPSWRPSQRMLPRQSQPARQGYHTVPNPPFPRAFSISATSHTLGYIRKLRRPVPHTRSPFTALKAESRFRPPQADQTPDLCKSELIHFGLHPPKRRAAPPTNRRHLQGQPPREHRLIQLPVEVAVPPFYCTFLHPVPTQYGTCRLGRRSAADCRRAIVPAKKGQEGWKGTSNPHSAALRFASNPSDLHTLQGLNDYDWSAGLHPPASPNHSLDFVPPPCNPKNPDTTSSTILAGD
ncbi:hypothetical protein CSAL01_04729 [Colletotrichum salicis]|uniref:Uncharacterized protein n=1 Tax=Colletotrichum salicis TaxID=1209931 RepID=A0A135U1W4_9PEZI|nr:hypothetical protein CSAL01_04729 [Colletotrichum salicis]